MAMFDPQDHATTIDPYPIFRELRDTAPAYHNEEMNFWALSRHENVRTGYEDWQTYTSTGGVTLDGAEKDYPLLIVKDPPEHRWHRKIIGKVFTPRRVAELEPFIRRRAGELLDAHLDDDEFDIAKDFAIPLPLDVISELIGIPEEQRRAVNRLSNELSARSEGSDPEKALQDIIMLLFGLAQERRAQPQDDVISMIIESEVIDDEDGATRRLGDQEIAAQLLGLAFAGHETVAKGIPSGLLALTEYPEARRELLADPSLTAAAVDEALRYDGPSLYEARTTTRDVQLHGVTIPAGEKVLLLTASALRDERVFDNPDVFDLHRTQDSSTLFFGFGIHRCLGAHLARLEMRVAFEEILARFPDFHVDGTRAERNTMTNVRGVDGLPFATKGGLVAAGR